MKSHIKTGDDAGTAAAMWMTARPPVGCYISSKGTVADGGTFGAAANEGALP